MADNLVNIEKCIARKWGPPPGDHRNASWGYQCTNNKIGGTDYCHKHRPNSRTDTHGDVCDGDGNPIKRNPHMAGAHWLALKDRDGIVAADNWYNNYSNNYHQ